MNGWTVRGMLTVAALAATLLLAACAPAPASQPPQAAPVSPVETPAPADNAAPTASNTPAGEGAAAETPAAEAAPTETPAEMPADEEAPAEAPAETPVAGAAGEGSVNSTFDGALDATIGAARDLAARLGVPLDQVNLVSEEMVEWPDGSLGCPQPGMMYTQVMTDGIRIVMEVGGVQYNYHGGGTQAPFLCENPA